MVQPVDADNLTAAAAAVAEVDFGSVSFVVPLSALVVLNVFVIVGNSLVITAVFTHTKLRSTQTNRFIVSLAAADLLVGLLVLPFSSANELLGYWPFGSVWCSIWLAVDVWMCTASILNLCAISFDRYLAISRPFRYPQLMSPLRVKMLIVCVWILSFVICLPPLVGWNERKRVQIKDWMTENATDRDDGVIAQESSSDRPSSESFPPQCKLTSEPGYIVYSALGSFWIPMIVMLGFYWRIYRTATAATAAFRRGFLEKKTHGATGGVSTSSSDNSITLRVHRGGGMSPTRRSDGSLAESGAGAAKNARRSLDERVAASAAATTGPRFALLCQAKSESPSEETKLRTTRKFLKLPKIVVTSNEQTKPMEMMALTVDRNGRQVTTTEVVPPSSATAVGGVAMSRYGSVTKDGPADVNRRKGGTLPPSRMTTETPSRLSKFPSLLPQLRSLNKEKKAAKTVGVIVGCFVLCWAPFFTVYLLGAFCPLCTPHIVFVVCFWLGYCNSAINPIIYGLCSRDFCYAFKKLVRCRCERKRANGSRAGGTRLTRMLRNLRIQIATTTTATATASVSDINVS